MFEKNVLKINTNKASSFNILNIESCLPKLTNNPTRILDDINQVYNLKLCIY